MTARTIVIVVYVINRQECISRFATHTGESRTRNVPRPNNHIRQNDNRKEKSSRVNRSF